MNERLLADAGGWQALKEARAIHQMDRVSEAAWAPPLLQGRVRSGETEFRAGLRILSRSNIENLCTCRDSKQRGMICAHSLAVGLAVLQPRPAAKPPAQTPHSAVPVARGNGTRFRFGDDGIPLEVAIVLPPNLPAAWERNALTVGVEAITGSRRVLLSALDPARTYRASEEDRRLIGQFSAFNNGEPPGVLSLPRPVFLALLGALAGHPRVTLGKANAVTIQKAVVAQPETLPAGAHLFSEGAESWLYRDGVLTPLIPRAAAPQTPVAERAGLAQTGETPSFTLKLEGSLNHLEAELESCLGNRRTTLQSAAPGMAHPAEADAVQRILAAGFAPPARGGRFVLKGEPRILAFFAGELPRLEREWTVTVGERFTHVARDLERVAPRLEIRSSGENWFDLSVDLSTASGTRFTAAELQRLLQSGQRSVRLKNQKVAVFDTALLDEFQEVLRDCSPSQTQPGLYRVNQRHGAYLAEFASGQGTPLSAPPSWNNAALAAVRPGELPAVDLGPLESVLRPYQRTGVFWLNHLMKNGLAGLLADEMGLGKTVQVLAFLRLCHGKTLVVCPSSLVFNWQREASRFAPELKVLAVTGPRREEVLREPADLYLTSYPLLRRDAALYRALEFETVILDEAQHIKNPDSQNAQAAMALRCRNRFALTGTPVENSVRDLWSLMEFLLPGYLGKREDFRERFEKEIEQQPGGPAHKRLRQRLKPFILRRTKREVISELPEKIEQVAYCELSAAQASLYRDLSEATRRQLSELAGSKDRNRARMTMLTALLRLRQACCDLRLLRPEEEPAELSGKVELLKELLEEAMDGGHRVLVFSQFATMLRLLAGVLDGAGISYCHLDGQTKNRAAEVDRFQAGQASVFLISLKAGGTGLNLTAADTVIHFDPWWNPAIEAQATDRAHRIGQASVVTSYKLITRGTVEEKILKLQEKKRAVIAASLESEEEPLMDGLTLGEIEELLA